MAQQKKNLRRRKPSGRAKKLTYSEYQQRKRKEMFNAGMLMTVVGEVAPGYLSNKSKQEFVRVEIDIAPTKPYEYGYHVIKRNYRHGGRVKPMYSEKVVSSLIEWATRKHDLLTLPTYFTTIIGKIPKREVQFKLERMD